MKYVVHNHLSTSANSNFVAAAAKKSNGKIVTTILVVAALGFLVYLITRPTKTYSRLPSIRPSVYSVDAGRVLACYVTPNAEHALA